MSSSSSAVLWVALYLYFYIIAKNCKDEQTILKIMTSGNSSLVSWNTEIVHKFWDFGGTDFLKGTNFAI